VRAIRAGIRRAIRAGIRRAIRAGIREERTGVAKVVAIRRRVEAAVTAAVAEVVPADPTGLATDPLVRPSERADFQSTVALAVAARTGRRAMDLAPDLARAIGARALDGVTAAVSGPGFLNLTVPDAVLWTQVGARLADDRLGVDSPGVAQRVVVDYSAPNIAKEMHVGHLRSTVIGDALARILGHLGAEVIRQNHLGDWGTQFGMLIQYLDEHADGDWRRDGELSVLEQRYRSARARFDADAGFAERARSRVVALQSGDPVTLAVWRDLVDESVRAFQGVYERMGVLLTPDDAAGESMYNPVLAGVADELAAAGIAVTSDGALCVFFDDVVGPDGEPVPLIVRKRDGGFGYAATDLAAVRYRCRELKADRILVVVDARQWLHFRMVFDTARRAGWLGASTWAVQVPFGTVLAADGRPFKTRAGDTVRLRDLLDAAVERARVVVAEKSPGLEAAERDQVALAIGMGAVKYADLSTSRTKDYAFDVDRMMALQGNTGVYLQYAHARTRSILRKLGQPVVAPHPTGPLHPAERALALALDGLDDTLADVALTLEPHRLCGYLFALARTFADFFEECPVLRAPNERQRANRAALCELTGRTLATGLNLLGIEAPERL
jgi:arginyl-tRNA synthetase